MSPDQEASIIAAFQGEAGRREISGTEGLMLFLQLESRRPELFVGIPHDRWQTVQALLRRRRLLRG